MDTKCTIFIGNIWTNGDITIQRPSKEAFAPIQAKVLPKMKVCRMTPAALAHMSTEYRGMGIEAFYTLQEIAHINAIVEEECEDTAREKLM